MGIAFARDRNKRQVLETEVLGYDATLVANIEQFQALGIDILEMQIAPAEDGHWFPVHGGDPFVDSADEVERITRGQKLIKQKR